MEVSFFGIAFAVVWVATLICVGGWMMKPMYSKPRTERKLYAFPVIVNHPDATTNEVRNDG